MTFDRSRREVLRVGAGLALGTLASPFLPGRAHAQGAALRVTHFGGPYTVLKDLVGKPFEDAKLGRVSYEVETSVSAMTKLQAAQAMPQFDVLMLARAIGMRGAASGLFLEFKVGDVPRQKEVVANANMPGGFGITFVFDAVDVMARADLKQPIQSWLDLVRDDLKGKISLPAANLSLPLYVLEGITRALGSNEKDDKAIEEAFKMLRGFKQHVRNFFNDPVQANQLIERGDIAVAPQFGLRIANLVKSNSDVVRMTPKEGAPAFPYDLCIPKNSPNVALARRYIDFAISKPIQERLAQNLLATSVRSDVAVPESLRKFMIADPKRLFFPDEQYVSTKQRDWLERWQREIQS